MENVSINEVVEAFSQLLNPILEDSHARAVLETSWHALPQSARERLTACEGLFEQGNLDSNLRQDEDPACEPKQARAPRPKQIVVEVSENFVPEDGDAFDAVLSALDFAEIPASVVERPAPFVAISLEGGLVRAVHSNVPMGYVVLDSDLEGAEDREIVLRPDPLNGGIREFYATAPDMADRKPEVIEELQQALAAEDASS